MYKKIISVISISILLVLTGCNISGPTGKSGGRYSLKNCKSGGKELKGLRVDKIVVKKSSHKMYLYSGGKVVKTCPVSLGKNASKGPKIKKGDYRTPTGSYRIVKKRCHPIKYRALYLSYPNAKDRARAKKLGVHPGNNITIHGQPYWNRDGHGDSYTLKHDWTNGCIAVTNRDLDYIWSHVGIGTPIILQD